MLRILLLSLMLSTVAVVLAPEASARCEDNPLDEGTFCEGAVSRTVERITCQNPRCE